jgi:competence protein ComEA
VGKIYISKIIFTKVVILGLIIFAGALWWFENEEQEEVIWQETSDLSWKMESETEMGENKEENDVAEIQNSKNNITMYGVHVTGAVNMPDQVLYLPEGSRVGEAIAAAGGATEEADLSQINLAGYIQDGQRIYVPILGENFSNIENTPGENRENLLTNINLATKIELLNLPGIGETYAERIIQHREENGPFEKVEDIMEVKGIGESKFNDLKDKITVE